MANFKIYMQYSRWNLIQAAAALICDGIEKPSKAQAKERLRDRLTVYGRFGTTLWFQDYDDGQWNKAIDKADKIGARWTTH